MTTITLTRPDDMHLHVRQGAHMESVVPMTARQFGRAIIIPNTKPYISTVDDAARYRDEIIAAVTRWYFVRTVDDALSTDHDQPRNNSGGQAGQGSSTA